MSTYNGSWDKNLKLTRDISVITCFKGNQSDLSDLNWVQWAFSVASFFFLQGQSALGVCVCVCGDWVYTSSFIRSPQGSRRASGPSGDLGTLLTSAFSIWSVGMPCCHLLPMSIVPVMILITMSTTLVHLVSTSAAFWSPQPSENFPAWVWGGLQEG